jgi:hypothetical protein
MEAASSSETSVTICLKSWHHIPDESNLIKINKKWNKNETGAILFGNTPQTQTKISTPRYLM